MGHLLPPPANHEVLPSQAMRYPHLIQTLNKEYYGPSPTTAPGGASTSNHEVLPSQAMRYSILEQGILWTFSKHPHIYQTLFNGPLPPPSPDKPTPSHPP